MRVLAVLLGVLGVLAAPAQTAAQTARVSMSASGSRVTVGEPFALEIRADISGAEVDDIEIPDFGSLEVLGRRVSRPFSFSFGFGTGGRHAQVQSQIVHSFTLRALKPGAFRIDPAVVVIGNRRFTSQPLTIEATGAAVPSNSLATPPGSAPSGTPNNSQQDLSAPPEGPLTGAEFDRDAFVRTVVDKSKIVVGEQLTTTVYLYVRGGLSEAPSITKEPTADGFWVQDLLAPNRSLAPTRQEVNGMAFNVYMLRRFAAFALREGTLQIGATAIEIGGRPSLFDLLAGPSAAVRRSGLPVSVEAVAPPVRKDASVPSFVGDLTLQAEVDRNDALVGSAVSLRVSAKGRGNLKSFTIANPQVDGLEVLTPEVEDQLTTELDQVGGERVFRWLLLARKPGRVQIDPFAIDVFDPSTQTYKRVVTDPLVLTITGDANAANAANAPAEESSGDDDGAPQFGPVRARSALLRAQTPIHQYGWFWWAVIAGPLLFAAAAATSALRERMSRAHADKRGERAFRSAQLALDAAQASARGGDAKAAQAAIANAIKSAVEARLDEPVGGLTYPALRQHLVARGMPAPLVERVVSQLEAGELSRFSPVLESKSELETALERSRGVVRELEKFSPGSAA